MISITFIRWASRQLRPIMAHARRQRLYRANPAFRDLDILERDRRRRHKPVRAIMARRSQLLHAELAREVWG